MPSPYRTTATCRTKLETVTERLWEAIRDSSGMTNATSS